MRQIGNQTLSYFLSFQLCTRQFWLDHIFLELLRKEPKLLITTSHCYYDNSITFWYNVATITLTGNSVHKHSFPYFHGTYSTKTLENYKKINFCVPFHITEKIKDFIHKIKTVFFFCWFFIENLCDKRNMKMQQIHGIWRDTEWWK